MDIIENNLGILKNLLINFKKGKNRQYRKLTLTQKLDQVKTIRNNIVKELTILEDTIDPKIFDDILKEEKILSGELISIINSKLEHLQDKPEYTLKNLARLAIISIRLSKTVKMASLIEIIKTVTALVPIYDGTPTKLNNIVDALNVIKQMVTNQEQIPTVINIVMTKLEGKARYAFPTIPASIDAVILKLKEVSTPTPPETIIAKLANCKQKSNISAYTKEVEELTMLLEAAYIAKQIPAEVAKTMATKEGVKHMATGLRDEKTSIILKAGQYANISQAANKVLEESPQNTNEATVNFVRSSDRYQKPRWQTPKNFQYSYRGRNQGQYNNNNNRYYQTNTRFQSRPNYQGRYNYTPLNNNTPRRNETPSSRGGSRPTGSYRQRNIYATENGEGPSINSRPEQTEGQEGISYPNTM